ncbi:dimethylaniline monooxygenase [Boeremia exigua]|uniref:dimethylaniline monooxygenase n=1 Tax=Boeremia exigua TaxID=749465 RepID=UPI001E8CA787|nr:dimethylaniline monooxygenase [Boeremia exigua]KAH6639041.1 dimethylaniline monooxygenase [Boeremia exigua]
MSSKNKRVAVIGAGISGVVTAAHLKNEGLDVTIFERSSAAGGIWLYDERKPLEPAYSSIPLSKAGSAYTKEEVDDLEVERLLHAPPGPCYVGLKNNVATPLLETTLNKFPPGTEDFVSHSVLKDYIQNTAVKTEVADVTHYNTEVQNVSKVGDKWAVQTTTLQTRDDGSQTRNSTTTDFDAVVVASGHYHTPRVPDIPGLSDWKRAYPGRVQHSKSYRKPEDYHGKNFLLIGGSVSATDIARELGPSAHTIYQSHRNGAFDLSAALLPENAIRVDEVVSFSLPISSPASLAPSDPIPLTLTLKSGATLCDIHHVILCTGYHLTLPFLSQYHADSTPVDEADEEVLVTDGTMFHNLHRDIFYIPDPSLAFVGVPFFTATFTLFEFQAMVVARVFSGAVGVPERDAMRREYVEKLKARGTGKKFHSLRDEEEKYVDGLVEWVNGGNGEALRGHTEGWKKARQEMVKRIQALFAAPRGPERPIVVSCQGGVLGQLGREVAGEGALVPVAA